LPGRTTLNRIHFRTSAKSLTNCPTTEYCLDEGSATTSNLAPAETQRSIATATTHAKVPFHHNPLFTDTSRMLRGSFKPAKNGMAFSFLTANLVFARSVFWLTLIAESHPGGAGPAGLGLQQATEGPWLSAALPDATTPMAKETVQARRSPGSGWWGLWNGGSRGPTACSSYWRM